MKITRFLGAVLLATLLAACGGGGGDPGRSSVAATTTSSGSSSTPATPTTPTTPSTTTTPTTPTPPGTPGAPLTPQSPQAANIYDLTEVQAYIRAANLYAPERVYAAAQAAGLDATQLDGIYGLAPGTAAAYIAAQRLAPLTGGTTVVGLGTAQPTALTAGALAYGRTATFSLTGSNLSAANLSVSVSNCSSLALAPGGSGTARQLTCRVSAPGTLTAVARTPAGSVLLSSTFTVPLPQVTLATSQGTMVFELNPALAPVTVDNFLAYVNSGFYTGTLFHRVIPNFVIQAGGFTAGPAPRTATYPAIVLESNNGLSNTRGTIAMARTNVFNSATSQFFVNLVDNLGLNYASTASPGYAVFGRVASGLDVMDRIAALPTRSVSGLDNVPQTDVTILSAQQTR